MTVRLAASIKRYVGESGDIKPELTPRDAGSAFMETDTGMVAYWDGSRWVERAEGEDVMEGVLHVLQAQQDTLLLILEALT